MTAEEYADSILIDKTLEKAYKEIYGYTEKATNKYDFSEGLSQGKEIQSTTKRGTAGNRTKDFDGAVSRITE